VTILKAANVSPNHPMDHLADSSNALVIVMLQLGDVIMAAAVIRTAQAIK